MAEKRRAIVLLTPGFPKDEMDTTCIPAIQQYVFCLAQMYPEFELHVIAFQYPYKKGSYKWNGINVYSAGGKGKRYSRLFAWRRVMRHLKEIAKDRQVIAIHSYWLTECTLIAQKFAKRNKINQVAMAIGQDVLKSNRYLQLLDFDSMHVVAMSQSIADRYNALTGKQVLKIIPTGIDRNKVNLPEEPRTIDVLGVGSLSELKNYSLFIEIVNGLKKHFPKIKAVIMGNGEQRSMLEEKIKTMQLEDNLKIIGELPHEEIFSYMNKSKIFLHTSSYEGQSTVIMEALAMGLSVVCFDVGRVHHDKVKVCGNKEEMIQQVKTVLNSTPDYSRQILYSIEDTVREFTKVYGI